MYKYIILLCLFSSLCGVLCDLNKEEGAECEWDGVKGKCVKETRCFTTLDEKSPKQPVCSKQGEVSIICCTDCELVNDTRNAVVSPTSGLFWKDGTKARDNCLQYLKELPYQCRQDGYYGGIMRQFNEEKKCHTFSVWAVGGAPPVGQKPSAKYPHQALLGYGTDLLTAKWNAGGSIISDRYILTVAHVNNVRRETGPLKFVAVHVTNRSDSPSNWQTFEVKRFIAHPEYKEGSFYYDIGLIETDKPIQFDNNVLPACLHVTDDESVTEKAVATTWRDLKDYNKISNTIQTINLEKNSEEECKAAIPVHRHLRHGYDHQTQMCYGSKTNPAEACNGLSGEPLMITKQFSYCMYTVIGISSFGQARPCNVSAKPDVYTRVSYYVPWIESVVWP